MAGLKALDIIVEAIANLFKRKAEKDEKDAGKSIMSGDSDSLNDTVNRLYKKSKKRKRTR